MDKMQPDVDALFLGMTRPPITMGVPMEFFGLNFILFGFGMILFMSLTGKMMFFGCVTLPLHAVAYLATEKDPHWMRVCPPQEYTRNAAARPLQQPFCDLPPYH
jgi:type IV secretory pathway VirB3-like protein